MVTSNHSPRLTRSGATILGVCFGSKALRTSLYSGVNCSSCPGVAGRGERTTAAMTAVKATVHRLRALMALSSSRSRISRVAQHLANGVQELSRAVRLGEIGRGARVHGLLVVAAEGERGDDDDGDIGRLGLAPDPPPRRLRRRGPPGGHRADGREGLGRSFG